MESKNGDNGMEKLLKGGTEVDDPRSVRNMRKERLRRRVQGVLDLMRGHLMLTLFIEIWGIVGSRTALPFDSIDDR